MQASDDQQQRQQQQFGYSSQQDDEGHGQELDIFQYKGGEQDYGEELGYREMGNYHMRQAPRFAFDNYEVPAKRSQIQKFEVASKIAINKLVDLKLISNENADTFADDFIRRISQTYCTMNGGAFALVFCCCDTLRKEFILDKVTGYISWKDITEYIKDPSQVEDSDQYSFREYIKDYGITIADLIRYLEYARINYKLE
jgi:hypothetical protein